MKTLESIIIKKPTRTWFRSDCTSCFQVNKCVNAGAFSYGERAYFLKVKGLRKPTTQAMLMGKILHEEEELGLKTLDEYGIENFFNDLKSGKEIELSELRLCSRLYALRGVIDIFKIKFEDSVFNITVTELKSNYKKSYMLQLAAYCLMLSDPDVEIIYTTKTKRGKEKVVGTRLYPKDTPIKVNITAKLRILTRKKTIEKVWMENNTMTPWATGISAAIQRRAKSLRKYHAFNVYFVEEIPLCKDCKKNDEYCPFWSPICSKTVNYGRKKSRQLFFGKNKILVKTKPKIRLPSVQK